MSDPRQRIRSSAACVVTATTLLITVCSLPQHAEAQDGAAAAETDSTESSWSTWSFRDVNVATLTQRLSDIGIPIPVELTGNISGRVNVDVPWTALRDARAWRLGGTLTSAELKIDELTAEDLAVVIEYRDGNLHLEQLRFRVPEQPVQPEKARQQPIVGLVTGQARMELVPRGILTATLTVDSLPLSPLSEIVDHLPPVTGLVAGSLTAEVDVDRLRDLRAWTVSGPVSLQRFTLDESPPADAEVDLSLSNGVVTARDFDLQAAQSKVTGEAKLELLGKQNWTTEAAVDARDLSAILQLVGRFLEGDDLQQLAGRLKGTMQASAQLSGTLSPVLQQASGQVALTDLCLRMPQELVKQVPLKPLDVERMEFDYDFREDELNLSNINATVAGGRVTGEADALLKTSRLQADLSWSDVKPNRLFGEPVGGDGTSDGRVRLTLPLDDTTDLSRWSIASNLTVSELSYEDWRFTDIRTGEMRLEEAVLSILELTTSLDGQPVSLKGTFGVQRPWKLEAEYELAGLNLEQLKNVPQLARLPDSVNGKLGLNGGASGTLKPLKLSAAGRLFGTSLGIEKYRIDQLRSGYTLTPDSLTLSDMSAKLYGGTVNGDGQISFTEQPGLAADVRWAKVNLGAIGQTFLNLPVLAGGHSDGTLSLSVPPKTWERPEKWRAAAEISVEALQVYEWKLHDVDKARLTVQDGQLRLSDFEALLDGEPLHAALKVGLQSPWPIEGSLNVRELALQRLESVPQVRELLSSFPKPDLPATADPSINATAKEDARRLQGKVDINGRFRGSLDPLQLRSHGSVQADALQFDQHRIEQIAFDFSVRPDQFQFEQIEAQVYGGSIGGEVSVSPGDQLGVRGEIDWSRIEMQPLLRAFQRPEFEARGTSGGQLSVTIPAGSLDDIDEWQASATVALDELRVFDWLLKDIEPIDVGLEQGRLEVQRIAATLDGHPVSAALTIGVEPPWPVDAQFDFEHVQLAHLGSLPQLSLLQGRLAGRATLTGQARGQMDPLTLTGQGSATVEPLTFDKYAINRVRFDYELAEQSLQISRIDARAYDGILQGTADVPLTPTAGGRADIQWESIDFGRLLGQIIEPPVELQGRSSGQFEISVPPGQLERPETWNIIVAAEIPQLSVRDVQLASVTAKATQQEGQLEYQAAGSVLSGAFELTGRRDAVTTDGRFSDPGSGNLTLRGANVAQAIAIRFPGLQERLRATADVTASWEGTADGLAWNAVAGINEVGLGDRIVAQGFSLRLQGLNQQIQIDDLTGRVAGGQLVATAEGDLSPMQPIDFRVDLRRASLEALSELAPFEREMELSGPLDVSLQGQTGQTWRVRGTAATGNGRISGVPLRSSRFPFSIEWHPESGRMAVQLTSGRVSLPSGRVTGKLKVRNSGGLTIDADYRIHDVRLERVARELGSRSRVARGSLSGSLRVSGRNVRSIDDIQATLVADLRDAQPTNMPVISQLGSFVPGAGASGAARFREGRIEAQLRRGVIQVSRLSLASDQLQVFIRGRVDLRGRIDLDANVSSGQGNDPVLAELLLSRLVTAVAAPAGALLLANDYLTNRVVHLGIRGTLRQPVIQVKPFESLGEEGVRFFLREATGGLSQ